MSLSARKTTSGFPLKSTNVETGWISYATLQTNTKHGIGDIAIEKNAIITSTRGIAAIDPIPLTNHSIMIL